MSNHLNSDQQLDQAVKEALESYEMPFDPSAWAEMEQQLTAQPKPLNPFKKFSFSLNTIIAAGIVGGGLLVYNLSSSSEAPAPAIQEPAVAVEQPKNERPKTEALPIANESASSSLTDSVAADVTEATSQPEVASNTSTPPPAVNSNTSESNTASRTITTASSKTTAGKTGDQKKNSKTQTISKEEDIDFDFMKVADRAAKSSPAFGDQIDPVKGFINPSNESENVKRQAMSKTSGWGDQVLKTIRNDSTVKEKSLPMDDGSSDTNEGSSSDKRSEKNDKAKKSASSGKNKDTNFTGKTDEAGTPAGDEVAEQGDSTEKPRVKGKNNPKYKSDRTIIDP